MVGYAGVDCTTIIFRNPKDPSSVTKCLEYVMFCHGYPSRFVPPTAKPKAKAEAEVGFRVKGNSGKYIVCRGD